MLTREQFLHAQARAYEYLERAGIVLTPEESKNIEVADFGLGELEVTGLELALSFQRATTTSSTSSPISRSAAPQSSRNDKSRVGAGVVWTRRGDARVALARRCETQGMMSAIEGEAQERVVGRPGATRASPSTPLRSRPYAIDGCSPKKPTPESTTCSVYGLR